MQKSNKVSVQNSQPFTEVEQPKPLLSACLTVDSQGTAGAPINICPEVDYITHRYVLVAVLNCLFWAATTTL